MKNKEIDISDLQSLYAQLPQVGALSKAVLDDSVTTVSVDGLTASAPAMLLAALSMRMEGMALVVMNDADEAGYCYQDLHQMLGDEGALFFPSSYRRAVKYAHREAANEVMRTEALAAMERRQGTLVVVTYPEALAEKVVSKKILNERTVRLAVDDECQPSVLLSQLKAWGMKEVDYVYEPGQVALRGSLIDVYPYNSEYPLRIDFFGHTIDTIRTFEVDTQLSKEKKQEVEIVPQLLDDSGEKQSLLQFLAERPQPVLLVAKDWPLVCDMVEQTFLQGFSQQARAEQEAEKTEMEEHDARMTLNKESLLVSGAQIAREGLGFKQLWLNPRQGRKAQVMVSMHTHAQPLFHKNFELLLQTLTDYQLRGYRNYILADSAKQNERIAEIIGSMEGEGEAPVKLFTPVKKTLHEGFVDDDLKLCLFSDHQIFDRYHKYQLRATEARGGKVALTLKEIKQFEPGDYVVHIDHGIGRFCGLVRMPIEGGYQEMIKLQYQNGDAVYVSIHSLYKIAKYKAQDNGNPPRLSQLGTGQWERIKERTKKKMKDMARDLIKLYATRRHERGFAFSHDSFMQHELEAGFAYEDTPDQMKATADVKADMEKPRPMDRLVCGDVGFGKTEVAVRAAFKAAADSKQVAVMVPTTVLAWQHYQTFAKRLKDFPVRVDYLSRARTPKQSKQVIDDLAQGKVDIIIGTHKLISKTVKFKDLGLLIIDEEQKFGVATKERLRQMKTAVDTLTMSATPIPRTLQFSLVGARDMSIIQTPPPNRHPIQTEIYTFAPDVIADAIQFEMSRNGQVYFVNNRISDLQRLAEMIAKHVPDARVAIGHGQMKSDELEQIILGFANHDYDVLLSTTIVENGIDIPNANTIIINGAHHFGLSDLHQMRGRVGRGNRKAFCYLIAPPLSVLPQEARRRLEALENFSDLGSGINIAMQDLDIRGAGNLLGAEQSGFIADLGYETYQKILNEAVVELKNEEFAEVYAEEMKEHLKAGEFVSDCVLESDIEMCFPDSFVPGDSERMLLYRELDNLSEDDEVERFRHRLKDRFGDIPAVAEELMRVVTLRRIGRRIGCEKIMLKKGKMTLCLVKDNESPYYRSEAFDSVIDYATAHPRGCSLREMHGRRSMLIDNVPTVEQGIEVLKLIDVNHPEVCEEKNV